MAAQAAGVSAESAVPSTVRVGERLNTAAVMTKSANHASAIMTDAETNIEKLRTLKALGIDLAVDAGPEDDTPDDPTLYAPLVKAMPATPERVDAVDAWLSARAASPQGQPRSG